MPPVAHWREKVEEWNNNAPICACGCNTKLHISTQKSLYYPRKFLPGHNARRVNPVLNLTNDERSVILGTLLGDFSLLRPHRTANPRLAFSHGLPQEDYAKHKMEVLHRFSWSWRIIDSDGYKLDGKLIVGACSCMPIFNEILSLVCSNESKLVTKPWLDLIDSQALAYWFMDDGSTSWSETNLAFVAFHTEGYTAAENDLICSWFKDRGYCSARVAFSKRRPYLYLPREDGFRLLDEVSPFLHSSMRYKEEGPRRG